MNVKKLNDPNVQTVSTVNSNQWFPIVDNNGNFTKVPLSVVKSAVAGGLNFNAIEDGVFIMYHRASDNYPLMVKPHKWPSIEAAGEIADGVVIFDGRKHTDAIIKASSSDHVTNTTSYAAGYCRAYSRANSKGEGLTAGYWWLPSVGEMLMIYANMLKINYALSLIKSATQLVEDWYWTSTEGSPEYAWGLSLNDGSFGNWNDKVKNAGHVRPVSQKDSATYNRPAKNACSLSGESFLPSLVRYQE